MMIPNNIRNNECGGFDDERINYESGRIYRQGILWAVLYAALFTAIRLIFTGGFGGITHYLTEAAIMISGLIILLIGVARWGLSKDERSLFEKHRYYLTAGKVFLIVTLAGYALSIPLRARVSNDFPVNELIIHLETLGCVYFFFAFKRREISFNYAFIAERGWGYYRRVLLNVTKLAGILLIPFGTAAIVELALSSSFGMLLAILFGYVYSVIGLGLDYFLLSWVEKLNYDEEFPRGLRQGTFVAFVLAAIRQAEVFVCRILAAVVAEFAMTQELPVGVTVGELLAVTSSAARRLSYPALVALALALCFLMEQAIHSKWVRRGVCGYVVLQAVDLVLYNLRTAVVVFLERHWADTMMIRQFTELTTYWSFAVWLISLAFTGMWIYGLIRECGVSKLLWLTVGLVVLCQAVGLFFGSQSMNLAHTLTVGGGALAALVWQFAILKKKSLRRIDCESE